MGARGFENAMDVRGLTGRRARRRRVEMLGADAPAGEVDDHRLDLDLGHPLGRMDRLTDRALGGLRSTTAPPFRPRER